jgi:phosphate starvation-inducible PhoH-like protein
MNSHNNNVKIMNFMTMKKVTIDNKKYIPLYYPKTENQIKYVDELSNSNNTIIVVLGPAGTGKTLFACSEAIRQLKSGMIDKIIITRPLVTVEEDLGFLPGNINKKMDPWTRPLFDIFLEVYSQREIDLMITNNVIEISPLAYMRGRTFKNAFIIADEMQNSSPNQMMMLTTRIGTNSKMVITGDLKQSDKGENSGLFDFIKRYDIYKKYNLGEKKEEVDEKNIEVIYLENKDIERNPIVKKVIDIYQFNITNTINKVNEVKTIKPVKIYNYESSYEYGGGYGYEIDNNLLNITKNLEKNYDNDCAMIPLKDLKKTQK